MFSLSPFFIPNCKLLYIAVSIPSKYQEEKLIFFQKNINLLIFNSFLSLSIKCADQPCSCLYFWQTCLVPTSQDCEYFITFFQDVYGQRLTFFAECTSKIYSFCFITNSKVLKLKTFFLGNIVNN